MIGVPKGWVSPEKGYWMPEAAGRDLLEAYRTAKDEASIARAAFLDLDADYRNFRTASVTAHEDLKKQLALEREATDAETRRLKRALLKARSPGFGVGIFATPDGEVKFGAGLVWRF